MISKLRRKFIFINMSLVILIFTIFLAAILISTHHQKKSDTLTALEHTLLMDDMAPRPIEWGLPRNPFINTFTFLVSVNPRDPSDFNSQLSQRNVSVSNDVISFAVEKALESNKTTGVISSLNLRFLIDDSQDFIRIAFADTSNEISSRNQLVLILLVAGSVGLVAFFFISLYLAVWTLRPVEQAWQQQQQFVADASHELKTPLTIMIANMSILFTKTQATIASQKKWLQNTQDEAMRMKSLVDDLLYLAKSDAQAPLVLIKLNLSDLLWNYILPFESLAYENKLVLHSTIKSDLFILGDEKSLKQLVAILMDNACKYTPEDGTISISLTQIQSRIILAVNNSGDPIPEKNLPYLFHRFYRVDESRKHQEGSFGLGLAIAQSIVEKHYAKITVESDHLQGTTFKVSLPIIVNF